MLALRLFPLALSLVALVLSKTQANHYKCSWGGPGNDPQSAGWLQYCTAKITNEDRLTADYVCSVLGREQEKVADYGKLAFTVLEIATPCNGGAFADPQFCYSRFWGACIGERNVTTGRYDQCLFMSKNDDCEWPKHYWWDKKPKTLTIFRTPYHSPVLEAAEEGYKGVLRETHEGGAQD